MRQALACALVITIKHLPLKNAFIIYGNHSSHFKYDRNTKCRQILVWLGNLRATGSWIELFDKAASWHNLVGASIDLFKSSATFHVWLTWSLTYWQAWRLKFPDSSAPCVPNSSIEAKWWSQRVLQLLPPRCWLKWMLPCLKSCIHRPGPRRCSVAAAPSCFAVQHPLWFLST